MKREDEVGSLKMGSKEDHRPLPLLPLLLLYNRGRQIRQSRVIPYFSCFVCTAVAEKFLLVYALVAGVPILMRSASVFVRPAVHSPLPQFKGGE